MCHFISIQIQYRLIYCTLFILQLGRGGLFSHPGAHGGTSADVQPSAGSQTQIPLKQILFLLHLPPAWHLWCSLLRNTTRVDQFPLLSGSTYQVSVHNTFKPEQHLKALQLAVAQSLTLGTQINLTTSSKPHHSLILLVALGYDGIYLVGTVLSSLAF